MEDDQLAYALTFDGVRLTNGDKWLVEDDNTGEYVVYTRKRYMRNTLEVYRGYFLENAVRELLKED